MLSNASREWSERSLVAMDELFLCSPFYASARQVLPYIVPLDEARVIASLRRLPYDTRVTPVSEGR